MTLTRLTDASAWQPLAVLDGYAASGVSDVLDEIYDKRFVLVCLDHTLSG